MKDPVRWQTALVERKLATQAAAPRRSELVAVVCPSAGVGTFCPSASYATEVSQMNTGLPANVCLVLKVT